MFCYHVEYAYRKSSCSLEWKKSTYDGGQKIVGYLVEHKSTSDSKWTRSSYSLIPDTYYTVTGIL